RGRGRRSRSGRANRKPTGRNRWASLKMNAIGAASLCQFRDLRNDDLGASDQSKRLHLIERLPVEGGIVEHPSDLVRQLVARGSDWADDREVLAIILVVAFDRTRGEDEAVEADRSHGRVQLLISLGEINKGVVMGSERVRQRFGLEVLDQHAAVMDEIVLQ